MMQTVQLSIADPLYRVDVHEALSRSCAWHVEAVSVPDPTAEHVMVLDEAAFTRLPLPIFNPERIVLIARKDPQFLARAWEAGIVSVLSADDPMDTVLLAIMSAALRVANLPIISGTSDISPTSSSEIASIRPKIRSRGSRRIKSQ